MTGPCTPASPTADEPTPSGAPSPSPAPAAPAPGASDRGANPWSPGPWAVRHRRPARGAVRRALLVAVATLLVVVAGAPATGRAATPPTRHFISNLHGSTAPRALGYTVFDTGPWGVSALPTGVQAMVWVGQKCPTPADAAFRATVDRLAGDPRVFGWYLSDEPHVVSCPRGAAALATRADYVRARSHGRQKSFVVLSRIADYGAFRPALSHVDLVGIDPYPCSVASPTCPVRKITDKVTAALRAGIPRAAVVPVFQAFGQQRIPNGYYRLPTATQMRAMLAEWHRLVPTPVLDYSYGWGHQTSANPTLVDSWSLRQVLAAHNRAG